MIYFLIFIAVCIVLVIVSSIIDNNRIVTKEYVVETDKIEKDVTIAFLSDLHNNCHGENNIKLAEKVKAISPDMIIMGGDMLTASFKHKEMIDNAVIYGLIEQLKEFPIYYGIGNHEYRIRIYPDDFGDRYDVFAEKARDAGAILLENDSIYRSDINMEIQGFELERRFYKRFKHEIPGVEDIRKAVGDRDNSKFRILLAHNPEYYNIYSTEADLVLSGHTHGGIMVLPLLGGVISPRLRLFPKYDGGRFDENGSTMIISRGLGTHTLPFRVFNPCELCVIRLKKR